MRKKILIVEDNSELLELQRLTLKEAGYITVTASNGLEAIKKARTIAPDLILLDLVLPELDGFAVCESLRQDPATANIPIIVLTGLNSNFTKFAGLEAGADDYVMKPASLPQLVSKIQHWLAQPRTKESAARPRTAAPRAPFARAWGRVE
jgi:DNA-binding response OmpR family regulator